MSPPSCRDETPSGAVAEGHVVDRDLRATLRRFGAWSDGEMDDAKVYQEVRFELIRLATALVGPSEADDVVSTVVARTLDRPGGLAGLADPKPYLVKAVINEARSRYRRRRVRRDALFHQPGDAPTVDYRDQLLEIVSRLPPQQRAATFLIHWEGHTATSAAELMGCRPATVRRYLHLAHDKLREALDE